MMKNIVSGAFFFKWSESSDSKHVFHCYGNKKEPAGENPTHRLDY
jgi:hypothetical protein